MVRCLVALGGAREQPDGREHAVPGLDQVVAAEALELLQLRDEGLAHLAAQLFGPCGVNTFVSADRGGIVCSSLFVQDRQLERAPCCARAKWNS